jgi:type IV fimbrial biogenesis protein FimT
MERSRGFTLIETLAVLAVAAALLSIGVPSLASLASTSRVSSASSDLLADLFLTRSEAAKRKLRVVMCKSADGQSCAATGGWQQGWIVFVDNDSDAERDAGETLLRVQPALAGTMRLTGTQPVAKYVSYVSTGNTKLVGGGFQAGTLTVCSESAEPATARQIIVNSTGRPRTQKVQLASCT